MTAEAVVMNKSAVALAADSAVTITSRGGNGRPSLKTYESANKLFELIKGSNVGVMIYSSASLNGVPWETIIKSFRHDNPAFSAPTVADYYEKLLSYISSNQDLLQISDEQRVLIGVIDWHLEQVFGLFDSRSSEFVTAAGRVYKSRFKVVATEILDLWENLLTQRDDLGGPFGLDEQQLKAKYGSVIASYVDHYYGKLPFLVSQRKRLYELAILSVVKDTSPPNESGLVLAGFGQREYFPSLVSSSLVARLDGSVLATAPDETNISTQTAGHLEAFAQSAPAMGWIYGISSEVRDMIAQHWQHWTQKNLAPALIAELQNDKSFTPQQRRKAAREVQKLARNQLGDFFDHMNDYQDSQAWKPLVDSVSVLPKDELGFLAESLVNITALKQRVSVRDTKTVGGAIDVALISIGDGFVWINRKHYFDSKLNPAWHISHGARV